MLEGDGGGVEKGEVVEETGGKGKILFNNLQLTGMYLKSHIVYCEI